MAERLQVVRANRSSDHTLRNLLEFYFHDLAEWFRFDQQSDGNYTESTDAYWDAGCDVYLLYAEELPIGFAIVGSAAERLPGSAAKDLTEFFVVRRHRRAGIGREFAAHIWELYPGPWLVRVYRQNTPALPFWRQTISAFSDGEYEEKEIQKNGGVWSYFVFEAS
jgi:predicted acetyltransferase